MTVLSQEQVARLLEPAPVPKQEGPLRFYDKEMRCSSRGCGSPTYSKVQGIPRCMMHALQELNLMLVEAGFKGVGTA